MPCYCEACTDAPSETYTRAYMQACELDYILGMPGKAERSAFFGLVAERRGAEAAEALREAAIAAWRAKESVPSAGVEGSSVGVSPTGRRGAR